MPHCASSLDRTFKKKGGEGGGGVGRSHKSLISSFVCYAYNAIYFTFYDAKPGSFYVVGEGEKGKGGRDEGGRENKEICLLTDLFFFKLKSILIFYLTKNAT